MALKGPQTGRALHRLSLCSEILGVLTYQLCPFTGRVVIHEECGVVTLEWPSTQGPEKRPSIEGLLGALTQG